MIKYKETNLAPTGTLLLTACNAAPPATPYYQQNPKWPPGVTKWKGSGKGSTPRDLDAPINFCQIIFFDPSTPSMRKVDNREKRKKGKAIWWNSSAK